MRWLPSLFKHLWIRFFLLLRCKELAQRIPPNQFYRNAFTWKWRLIFSLSNFCEHLHLDGFLIHSCTSFHKRFNRSSSGSIESTEPRRTAVFCPADMSVCIPHILGSILGPRRCVGGALQGISIPGCGDWLGKCGYVTDKVLIAPRGACITSTPAHPLTCVNADAESCMAVWVEK